jgi:hypothetical protein
VERDRHQGRAPRARGRRHRRRRAPAPRPGTPNARRRPTARRPAGSRFLQGGENPFGAAAGRIDALTTGFAPDAALEPAARIRRLVEDYPAAEAAYHRRTVIHPAFHIVARDAAPSAIPRRDGGLHRVAPSYDRIAKVRRYGEASPWQQHDRDDAALSPATSRPSASTPAAAQDGCGAVRRAAGTGLTPVAARPEQLFAWFAAAAARGEAAGA